jgi:hypothetical protein
VAGIDFHIGMGDDLKYVGPAVDDPFEGKVFFPVVVKLHLLKYFGCLFHRQALLFVPVKSKLVRICQKANEMIIKSLSKK